MNCPKCNYHKGEWLAEEVDIGVGVQRFVFGYDCPLCGVIGKCPQCGAWDFQVCMSWCEARKPKQP